MLFYQIVHESIGLLGPPDTQEQTEQFKVCQSAVCICRTQYWFYIIITLSNAVYKLIITITKLSNVIGYRVWLIVAGRVSRIQSRGRGSNVAVAGSMSRSRVRCRGRGSNVAVAGIKSRSRVQCRGRGKWFGVQGNWVEMTDMNTI